MTPSRNSLASSLRALPEVERLKILRQMRPETAEALRYTWRFWGRPEQFAPRLPDAAPVLRGCADLPERLRTGALPSLEQTADWTYWLLLAGRGFGKTRAGAEFAIGKARALPGSHGALVAATSDDARKTMLSAGMEHIPEASGILAHFDAEGSQRGRRRPPQTSSFARRAGGHQGAS
jgi:hypothetical protein